MYMYINTEGKYLIMKYNQGCRIQDVFNSKIVHGKVKCIKVTVNC